MGENVELIAGVPPWVKAARRVAEAPPLRLVRPPEEPATPKVADATPDVAARPVTPEIVGVLREIACAVRELRGCLLAPPPPEGSVGHMGEPAPTPALVGDSTNPTAPDRRSNGIRGGSPAPVAPGAPAAPGADRWHGTASAASRPASLPGRMSTPPSPSANSGTPGWRRRWASTPTRGLRNRPMRYGR